MDNIFYSSNISYSFVKKLNNIMDKQYNEYKKQIINNILEEIIIYYKLNDDLYKIKQC